MENIKGTNIKRFSKSKTKVYFKTKKRLIAGAAVMGAGVLLVVGGSFTCYTGIGDLAIVVGTDLFRECGCIMVILTLCYTISFFNG